MTATDRMQTTKASQYALVLWAACQRCPNTHNYLQFRFGYVESGCRPQRQGIMSHMRDMSHILFNPWAAAVHPRCDKQLQLGEKEGTRCGLHNRKQTTMILLTWLNIQAAITTAHISTATAQLLQHNTKLCIISAPANEMMQVNQPEYTEHEMYMWNTCHAQPVETWVNSPKRQRVDSRTQQYTTASLQLHNL